MRRTVAVLALAGLVTGCGAPRLSYFTRRGNAICAAANRRVARLVRPAGMGRSEAAAGGWVDAYAAEKRLELTRLRALGYPRATRRPLQGAYRAIDAVLSGASRRPLGFDRRALNGPYAQLRARGLTACRP